MICPPVRPILLGLAVLTNLGRTQTPGVVINEIHYAEDDPTVHSEFIELHNPGTKAVDLGEWFFDSGISFKFPAGTTLEPDGYLIVCEDPPTLRAKWGVSGAGVHSWNRGAASARFGQLRNTNSQTITLRSRDRAKHDEVDYALGFPWPTVGDPPNYSIELIHPALDNSLGGNWRASNGDGAVARAGGVCACAKRRLELSQGAERAVESSGRLALSWISRQRSQLARRSPGAPFGYGDPVNTMLTDMRSPPSPRGYSGIYRAPHVPVHRHGARPAHAQSLER